MQFSIKRKESYSRGELLLRTFFGAFYIGIPHIFVMMFVAIWAGILSMIAWWVVLFTGKYPQSWFDFQVKLLSWSNRFSASLSNLIDGYPQIGVNGSHPDVTLEVTNPPSLSRGKLILRTFFGWLYVGIPHIFCLYFRMIWGAVLGMIAWWVLLFTAKYPESWFEFQVGTQRWLIRYGLYMSFMTDDLPPFSGK